MERTFAKHRLQEQREADGALFVYGSGYAKDYGAFGSIITSLKDKAWFMDYVTRWICETFPMSKTRVIIPNTRQPILKFLIWFEI
ncbi:MAG: hypothetical protein HFE76_12415 [Firmicutes bacterium]|nr:hypothetical protein [Bacillota bacterium]